MTTTFYRIEKIKLEPLLLLADDFDDAANRFRFSLLEAFGNMPVADFDVTKWKLKKSDRFAPLRQWSAEGKRGFVWPYEGGWEMMCG